MVSKAQGRRVLAGGHTRETASPHLQHDGQRRQEGNGEPHTKEEGGEEEQRVDNTDKEHALLHLHRVLKHGQVGLGQGGQACASGLGGRRSDGRSQTGGDFTGQPRRGGPEDRTELGSASRALPAHTFGLCRVDSGPLRVPELLDLQG